MALLHYVHQCSSTNDEIFHYLNEEELIGLYTFCQTRGRGQYGNTWEIAPQQNLAFSMAFSQNLWYLNDILFNFYAANLLRRFIAKKTDFQVQVKWPNDLIIGNKKVSGMLIEKKKWGNEYFYIIGIGINILQKDFQNLPKAGSIFTQTGLVFDLHQWAEEMFSFFTENLFTPIPENILDEYNEFLFKKNEITVFEIQKIRQNGIIQKVDNDGYLWVNLEKEGQKKFFNKEIVFLY